MAAIEKWKFGTWKELESDPGLFTLLERVGTTYYHFLD